MAADPRAPVLGPEEIAAQSFETGRRGYDTTEVRAFLETVADSQRTLLAALVEADERADAIVAEAEGKAAELVREAQDEARRILSEVAVERDRGFAEGSARAESVLAEAHKARLAAEEEAAAEAARLIEEAKGARAKVLTDLRRRRKEVRGQVEQLHAAREKLLGALTEVRNSIEATTAGLRNALPEARTAAAAAARRVASEVDPSIEDLDREIEALRFAGLGFGGDREPDEASDGPPVDEAPAEAAPAPEAPAEEAPPPAPPAPPAHGVVTERRSSAVRIMRPLRPQDPVTGLPEGELQPMEAPDPVETVRLVTAEDIATGADAAAAEVEVEVEPELEVEVEVEAEVEAEVDTEAAAADDAAAEEGRGSTRPEPATVDALFARLREGRAERVAEAEEVLAPEAPEAPEADVPPAAPLSATNGSVATADDVVVHRGGGDDRDALLARRDTALRPVSTKLGRRLKRLLADEQNELLDALRRTGTPDALPDPVEWVGRWAQAAGTDLATAAAIGSAFFDPDAEVTAPTQDALAEAAEALGAAVAVPLHDRLASAIGDADGDADLAAEAARSAYRTWRSDRLGPAVDDAVFAAFALGVASSIPDGAMVCWIVEGGVACPDAEDNALAGALGCGEPFPTGHSRPPAHPGCRCLVAPAAAAD